MLGSLLQPLLTQSPRLERVGQSSNFDLCIWATGMGFLDVCVASLVMLPRRTDASPFVHLWAEPQILVGPTIVATQDLSFWEPRRLAVASFIHASYPHYTL